MASCQELLDNIRPDMKLSRGFFLKIYGYELTWPGFAENAIIKLEASGCRKAREYYTCIVAEYEYKHEKEMVEVAKWYRKQLERGEEPRVRQREMEQCRIELLSKKKQLLLEKKRLLLTENLQE